PPAMFAALRHSLKLRQISLLPRGLRATTSGRSALAQPEIASEIHIRFIFAKQRGCKQIRLRIVRDTLPACLHNAGGFPAMTEHVAFLMDDLVLFTISFYFLREDLKRVSVPAEQSMQSTSLTGPA